MPTNNRRQSSRYQHCLKSFATLVVSFCLCACATVDTRPTPTDPSTTESSDVEADNSELSDEARAARAVAGAVIATAATAWLVAEFIEEKVVPAVLGLAVGYLLYKAARDSDSNPDAMQER